MVRRDIFFRGVRGVRDGTPTPVWRCSPPGPTQSPPGLPQHWHHHPGARSTVHHPRRPAPALPSFLPECCPCAGGEFYDPLAAPGMAATLAGQGSAHPSCLWLSTLFCLMVLVWNFLKGRSQIRLPTLHKDKNSPGFLQLCVFHLHRYL